MFMRLGEKRLPCRIEAQSTNSCFFRLLGSWALDIGHRFSYSGAFAIDYDLGTGTMEDAFWQLREGSNIQFLEAGLALVSVQAWRC